jgi:NitT/TauT family transport system substrate-binding protein
LFYAKDRGTFEANGLDVDLSTPADYGAVVPAMVAGSADIAYGIISQIELAYAKGVPIRIIAPAAINDARHPTTFMVVAKNSPLQTARDLNGKTLGTSPLKTLGTYAVEEWMNMHGGDASTVKWIDIPFPLCGEALDRGRIDAALIIEPFNTASRSLTRVFARPYEAVSPYFLGAAYFTTVEYAAAHPDVIRRFAAAIHDASVWANRNPAQSGVIMAKYSKVDMATMNAMSRAIYAEALTPASLQPSIDFSAKFKMLDASYPAKDLIYHP